MCPEVAVQLTCSFLQHAKGPAGPVQPGCLKGQKQPQCSVMATIGQYHAHTLATPSQPFASGYASLVWQMRCVVLFHANSVHCWQNVQHLADASHNILSGRLSHPVACLSLLTTHHQVWQQCWRPVSAAAVQQRWQRAAVSQDAADAAPAEQQVLRHTRGP